MTEFPSPSPEAQGTDDTSTDTNPPQAAPASSGTSPADADHEGGTASPEDASLSGISDDQLPEDLQPTEDNPLAQPLDPDDEKTKSPEELEMDATQDDGEAAEETGGGANSGEGAQGAGLAEG